MFSLLSISPSLLCSEALEALPGKRPRTHQTFTTYSDMCVCLPCASHHSAPTNTSTIPSVCFLVPRFFHLWRDYSPLNTRTLDVIRRLVPGTLRRSVFGRVGARHRSPGGTIGLRPPWSPVRGRRSEPPLLPAPQVRTCETKKIHGMSGPTQLDFLPLTYGLKG